MSQPASMPMWADAHNHLHTAPQAIESYPGAGCLINATCEADWPEVLATATRLGAHCHCAFGIHPWHAADAQEGWKNRLKAWLENHPQAGIGECGLDAKRLTASMNHQTAVFTTQLRLARELRRHLSIHCVAAWGRLMEILDHETPPPRWLLHGFTGSAEIARACAAKGAYFSIPIRALEAGGTRILESFRTIPPDRILLETDALNDPEALPTLGSALAGHLGFPVEDFARLTRQNSAKFLAT